MIIIGYYILILYLFWGDMRIDHTIDFALSEFMYMNNVKIQADVTFRYISMIDTNIWTLYASFSF